MADITKASSPSVPFPLSMASPGEKVEIDFIRAGIKLHERLSSMGINVNDIIAVEQRQKRGAVIISKDGCKYGLGGGMAQKIFVKRSKTA